MLATESATLRPQRPAISHPHRYSPVAARKNRSTVPFPMRNSVAIARIDAPSPAIFVAFA